MTRGILELGTDALEKIGMELGNLPDALDARADFYAACIADKDIKRIGFTPDDDFPIPRNSFPAPAQKPARKKKEEDEPEWVVATESIYVNSPNWNENKQKTRMWQGVDSGHHECLFVIEDAEFWGRISVPPTLGSVSSGFAVKRTKGRGAVRDEAIITCWYIRCGGYL